MKETVFLNNDREMPLLGLGVYKTADDEAETAISAAVNAGYRLIDTASVYKKRGKRGKWQLPNAASPARSYLSPVRSGIQPSVWVILTVLFHRSLERLKLDYLDLYLIHWPVPGLLSWYLDRP